MSGGTHRSLAMGRTPAVDRIIRSHRGADADAGSGSHTRPARKGEDTAGQSRDAKASSRSRGSASLLSAHNVSTSGMLQSGVSRGLTGLQGTRGVSEMAHVSTADGEEGAISDVVLAGVRAAIRERSHPKNQSDAFARVSWVFGESAEPIDRLKQDLERVREALAANPREPAGPSADITSFRRSPSVAKGSGSKAPAASKKTILRDARLPASPAQKEAQLMVVSLSAPGNRPKTVQISQEEDEVRYHERDYEPLKLMNVENPAGFAAIEGRWGLRFPTPKSMELEEAEQVLFRHSYPAYAPVPKPENKAKRAKQREARAEFEDLDLNTRKASGSGAVHPSARRSQTPSRMGFASDLVGQMAYYTNQVPSKLRPRHGVKKLSRDKLFTPVEGRRLWEHQHLSEVQGTLGPPSRHVQTRAGRVVEEAKERAMMLMSPRKNWAVRDSAGSVQTLPGLVLSCADATPLQGCEPYPIFCTLGLSNPNNQPAWALSPRSRGGSVADTEEEDEEVRQVLVAALIRDGLLPRPKDSNDPQPSTLHMSVEELKKKHQEERDRTFEKMCHRIEASTIATTMRWGPQSKAHARLEDIRSSPDRRQSLETFVKKELPKIKKQENAHYYKQNMIAKNRDCVSRMSCENERERKLEAERRSQSVPLTLERERERLWEQQKLLEDSEHRKTLQLNMLENKQRTKQERELQEAHERAVAEYEEYQRTLRIREKSEQLRSREFSQPFLTALMVICFAIRLNPKARKLVPKKKTNVKYVIRIQRWWRVLLQYRNDPFNNKSLKDIMDHKEEKILSRARHMIHMWQKSKHVAAIAQFLRELRDIRQDVVLAVNAKYAAVRVIQRCVRAFSLSRKTSFVVWEMQWIRFERARNRRLMRQWKGAWQATMLEISRVVKVVPGNKRRPSKVTKSSSTPSAKWVGKIMDDFIANLPEEVKNIIDVPADVRRYLLARHKVQLVEQLVLRLDEHKRLVAQMRVNRKLRDELCLTFPHLGDMDLRSPELSFLSDVDNEPPFPHLPLALKEDDLLDMILFAQKIARGKEERPISPPEGRVLKAIPRNLQHMRLNGISLDDAPAEGSGSLTRYLGADRGLSKDLIEQCSPSHSPTAQSPSHSLNAKSPAGGPE